jgi:hypothetical protein
MIYLKQTLLFTVLYHRVLPACFSEIIIIINRNLIIFYNMKPPTGYRVRAPQKQNMGDSVPWYHNSTSKGFHWQLLSRRGLKLLDFSSIQLAARILRYISAVLASPPFR